MKSTSLGHDFNVAHKHFMLSVAGTEIHEEVVNEVRSGSIKNHPWIGRRATFFHAPHGISHHSEGTVVGVHRLPTFSAMVPWKTMVNIKTDAGHTYEVRHHMVKVRSVVKEEAPAMSAGAVGDPGHVQNATDNYASQKKTTKMLRRKKPKA